MIEIPEHRNVGGSSVQLVRDFFFHLGNNGGCEVELRTWLVSGDLFGEGSDVTNREGRRYSMSDSWRQGNSCRF